MPRNEEQQNAVAACTKVASVTESPLLDRQTAETTILSVAYPLPNRPCLPSRKSKYEETVAFGENGLVLAWQEAAVATRLKAFQEPLNSIVAFGGVGLT